MSGGVEVVDVRGQRRGWSDWLETTKATGTQIATGYAHDAELSKLEAVYI